MCSDICIQKFMKLSSCQINTLGKAGDTVEVGTYKTASRQTVYGKLIDYTL